jgi:aspartate 1-decarboxylase
LLFCSFSKIFPDGLSEISQQTNALYQAVLLTEIYQHQHLFYLSINMLTQMLKAKLHKATITEADLSYEGSLTIDKDLMDAVGIIPFEKVKVYNINNGERFDTYAIEGPTGSGVIGLNGAAARKGMVGDRIIIVTYALLNDNELVGYYPQIALLDDNNTIKQMLKK